MLRERCAVTDPLPQYGGSFLWVSYTYDANGNRLSQNDWSGTSTFTYDTLNRLTQSVHPGTYGTWSWTYDAVGNRTQQVAPSGTTGYSYDGNNRLTQAGGTTYSYDANGNLLSISGGRSFTYDSFNRLTQTTGSSGAVTYTYNGDGLKVRRAGPDGVTRYYHDGIRPVWETDDARVFVAEYMRDIFGNLLARREASGARYHFHYDGLGSTHGLTDASANVSATMLYDAWGQVRSSSGSAHGKYRFTGAELDMTTGLYHMGARFYDPGIGRWLSEDPVQDKHFEPVTLNFYTYAMNNPMFYVDPDGSAAIIPLIGALIARALLALGPIIASQSGGTRAGISTAVAIGSAGISTVARILVQRGQIFEKGNRYYDTPVGKRLHDLIVRTKEGITGIEVKAGFVEFSARIREQIQADAYLLRERILQRIEWFIEDADPRVLDLLREAGIKVQFYAR